MTIKKIKTKLDIKIKCQGMNWKNKLINISSKLIQWTNNQTSLIFCNARRVFKEGRKKRAGRKNKLSEFNHRLFKGTYGITMKRVAWHNECCPWQQHLKSRRYCMSHPKSASGASHILFKLYYIYIKKLNYFWPYMIITKKLEWNDESGTQSQESVILRGI
jgi:hypothetical protein